MQKKLLFSFLAIILIAIGISIVAFWTRGHQFIDKQSQDYHLKQAQLIGDIFDKVTLESKEDFQKFAKGYGEKYQVRITIIDRSGEVLADSSTSDQLENHKNREEIIGALKGKSVTVNRYSQTMKNNYSYSAVPVSNGDFNGVLRVSLPLSALSKFDDELFRATIYTIIICFIIATFAAFIFTNFLSKPIDEVTKAAVRISKGNYNTKIYTREKYQIGKLAGAFNTMTTNLKETIDSLTQRNIELEAMLTSMTGGVVAIDDSNEVLFYNKAFVDIVNPLNNNMKGQSLYNVLRNVAIFDAIDQVRKTNSSVTMEGTLLSGNNKNIQITATPLGREDKKWFGVLLIIEDVTQIKKLERMRSDFVSNVTHELKTPLTSIRGFIDTLKNGAIKDEAVANKFIDIIDIEAERLSSLIQDILLLSEIESKNDYDTEPVDINQCALSVIDLLEPKLTDKIDIIFEPQANLKLFTCNPGRMKQLLINLLDNAIKYTEEGTVTLICKEEACMLMIKVKDTGIGIEKEQLPRIFERFYRVDKGRARKQGGTGLGLSIVKHIVELYNGTIQVDSQLGEGTEFVIRLPYNYESET